MTVGLKMLYSSIDDKASKKQINKSLCLNSSFKEDKFKPVIGGFIPFFLFSWYSISLPCTMCHLHFMIAIPVLHIGHVTHVIQNNQSLNIKWLINFEDSYYFSYKEKLYLALLAGRYKVIANVGEGQTSVMVQAEVND